MAERVAVSYLCECGQAATIHSLYWCRHCITLRCPRCVLQEIDSYFCPFCLDEHMPSTEAKLNQNRCQKCTECPICTNSLSTVVFTPGTAAAPELLQLVCSYCHWSSTDIKMLGTQEALLKEIKQRDQGEVAAQVSKLVEHYQTIAVEEGRAMEQRRQSITQALYRKTRTFSSRYTSFQKSLKEHTRKDLQTTYEQRRNKMYDQARNEWVDKPAPFDESLRSIAKTSFEPLGDEFFSGPADLNEVTTLQQRYAMPATQPHLTKDMSVLQTRLLAKRSKRCTSCQHNLVKPELSPVSIKFKMHLFALHNVPNIKVLNLPAFKFNQPAEVVLVVTNPMDQRVEVKFAQPSEEEEAGVADESVSEFDDPVVARPELFSSKPTAEVILPPSAIVLKEHDPVQEMALDESSHDDVDDDPGFVVARHANSIHLKLTVTPLRVCDDVSISFCLKYACKVTTASLRQADSAEEEFKDVVVPVFISLGPVTVE